MSLFKNRVSAANILKQLKADLIGKDSYRGVTLSYSWLANQFGHFSLGYVPTLLVYTILKKYTSIHGPALWAALSVSITWFLFESYNFLGPLLLNKHSLSKLLYIPSSKRYIFQPAWGNIAFDTATDLCFFWFGAFSASFFLHHNPIVLWVMIILVLLLLYPSYYWYVTKIYEQNAQYPLQFRLSQWDISTTNSNKKVVLDFLGSGNTCNHLFVFGGRRSGKTTISVGIANEFSIRHHTCSYTTGIKLYTMFFETDEQILGEDGLLWSWRDADLFVIDDINPGFPIKEDLVSAEEFLELLNTYAIANPINQTAMKSKKVIWVMGDYEDSKKYINKWKEILTSIGVSPGNIVSIDLGSTVTGLP